MKENSILYPRQGPEIRVCEIKVCEISLSKIEFKIVKIVKIASLKIVKKHCYIKA